MRNLCSLRDVDKEVTYLLKLIDNIYIIYTCKVVVAVALDIDDMLLSEVVSAFIDIVLRIDSVRGEWYDAGSTHINPLL